MHLMLIMFNLATKVQNATRVYIKGGFFARVVVRVRVSAGVENL